MVLTSKLVKDALMFSKSSSTELVLAELMFSPFSLSLSQKRKCGDAKRDYETKLIDCIFGKMSRDH